MTITQSIITIFAVMLGTMVTRFLPFILFPEGKKPPAFITYLGTVLPYAVIGFLVVFSLKDAQVEEFYLIPEVISLVFIGILHRLKKNTLISIGGGTIFYMLLVQNFF